MPKHLLKVTHIIKVRRVCEIEIEADTEADAIEKINYGVILPPSADSQRWVTTHESLESETVELANPTKQNVREES